MPVAEAKIKIIAQPFGIEADSPRNADVMLQSIPGCRLRGRVEAGKPVIDAKTGDPMIPQDQSRHLGKLPPIPGMQLHVNPAKCTYQIIDPLFDDDDLCERIRKGMEDDSPFRTESRLRGVPPQKGTLDIHRMKTLVREMLWLISSNDAKVVKGSEPELEDINQMAGKYLNNPGSRVRNSQPRYEEDMEAWVNNLNAHGG